MSYVFSSIGSFRHCEMYDISSPALPFAADAAATVLFVLSLPVIILSCWQTLRRRRRRRRRRLQASFLSYAFILSFTTS